MLLEALVAILAILIIWLMFFREEEHPIDRLPGPPRKPIVGNALDLMNIKPEDVLQEFYKFMQVYGDRFVFHNMSIRVLNVGRPSDVEVVMSHSRNIKKSRPYQFVSAWLGNGLLLSTGSHWHNRRKILTPTFHFNILKSFATIFEEKTQSFVKLMKEKKGEAVDLIPLISDFTLFAICETAMGTKLDSDQSASTKEYKNAVQQIGLMALKRMTKFWLHNDFIFNCSQEGKEFRKMLTLAHTFADKVIMDRKANRTQNIETTTTDDIGTKKRLAMLDLLLDAEQRGEIDMEGIRDEVNTFMFEGHDTTAAAITFCLMLLADHEDIQERIYEERQSIIGEGEIPGMTELAKLKYLEAVIKETLRLYPSVPFIGRLITEDFMMGDILVKKDTTVDVHIFALHHREDMFSNPESFDPERFLGAQMKHPYAYVPFSAGPRNCIGQRYAMLEIKCALSEIIHNFKLVPKTKGVRPRIIVDLVLRPIDPIYIKFIPRSSY